jgi:hypothetical protein
MAGTVLMPLECYTVDHNSRIRFSSIRVSRTSTTRFAVEEFFVLRVAQVKKAKDFFYRRATYKGTYVEAVESAKEGEKVTPPKARFRVPYTKKFFFWFTSIWVLRDPSRLNIGSYVT